MPTVDAGAEQISNGLAEKQELQQQETINKVLRTCVDIKNEGKKVTISSLVYHTGLSRSTFSKPHIRELLAEYGYSTGDVVVSHKRKKVKQDEIIVQNNGQIAKLRAKNMALEKECELLRGRLFLMMEKRGVK